MEKIKKLTEEQEKELIEFREEWLKTGLSTEPANFSKSEEIITDFYKMTGKERPIFIRCSCPLEANLMINLWGNLFNKNCFWWYPYDGVCFITDRPKTIRLENGVLHNESGPTIETRSGFKVYSLFGKRVPEWVIKTPKGEIDTKRVLAIKNAEQRFIIIKYIGVYRFLDSFNHKIIDKKNDYALLLIKINDRWCEFLQMKNPTTGEIHIEGVKPGTKTVTEALAWRLGLSVFKNATFEA